MTDLRDPLTLATLTRHDLGGGCAVWTGGSQEWPEVDGVPYLRVGREELTARVVSLLRGGDTVTARAELLRDQDDFARQPPPSMEAALAISREEPPTFRAAMAALEYGPVAHYFAHRTSTPTFLSGLALLDGVELYDRLLEVCCGVGHFLRHVERCSDAWQAEDLNGSDRIVTAGVDVVWSKLWLARRYVGVRGTLVCADACGGHLPFADGAFTAGLCHDAIYFLPDKAAFLNELRRAAGAPLIGHAHNRLADHGDVAGTPLTPAEYAVLAAENAAFYDDASLTEVSTGPPRGLAELGGARGRGAVEELNASEAICWTEWAPGWTGDEMRGASFKFPPAGYQLNPLLKESDGRLVPDWPMPRFAEEYADAEYLTGPVPTAEQIAAAARGHWAGDAAMEDFVRRRTFIDLPERW